MSADSGDAPIKVPEHVQVTIIEDELEWPDGTAEPTSDEARAELMALPACVRAALTAREAIERLGFAPHQVAFAVTEDGYFGIGLLIRPPEGYSAIFMGSIKGMTEAQAASIARAMILFTTLTDDARDHWWTTMLGTQLFELLDTETKKLGMMKAGSQPT
ncbi:MAG: hypothetical protein ACHREM_00480 [Polyangiales bacterium]